MGTHMKGEATRVAILLFVQEFCLSNGYPPTYREIAEGVGLSTGGGSVSHHIEVLARRGWLVHNNGKMRMWQVGQVERSSLWT